MIKINNVGIWKQRVDGVDKRDYTLDWIKFRGINVAI